MWLSILGVCLRGVSPFIHLGPEVARERHARCLTRFGHLNSERPSTAGYCLGGGCFDGATQVSPSVGGMSKTCLVPNTFTWGSIARAMLAYICGIFRGACLSWCSGFAQLWVVCFCGLRLFYRSANQSPHFHEDLAVRAAKNPFWAATWRAGVSHLRSGRRFVEIDFGVA